VYSSRRCKQCSTGQAAPQPAAEIPADATVAAQHASGGLTWPNGRCLWLSPNGMTTAIGRGRKPDGSIGLPVDLDWLARYEGRLPASDGPCCARSLRRIGSRLTGENNRRGARFGVGAALASGVVAACRKGKTIIPKRAKTAGDQLIERLRPVKLHQGECASTERCPHPAMTAGMGARPPGPLLARNRLNSGTYALKIRRRSPAISRPLHFLTVKTRNTPRLGEKCQRCLHSEERSGRQAPEPTSTTLADRTQ